MALNVGPDFKQRWLTAPEAVRQTFIDDLHRISEVLQPDSDLKRWVEYDQQQQQQSFQKIDQAYAELKIQLIEEARIRRQQMLEQRLAQQRADQAAYAQALYQDELQQFAAQTETLASLRTQLDQEILDYTARYQKNPENGSFNFAKGMRIADEQILSELDSVRVRLELEAETRIEEAVQQFRSQLQAAAQEEIEYILKHSQFSKET
ncbi:cell division protein BlhA [Acinetobacter indicus]|uniref:cell division protein BlhA n=1 Tax=Acinetobacter indicus TaxID=756892 RepID=UPI0014449495